MQGLGQSNVAHDFNAYDSTDKIWNGSVFVTKAVADYASYRIAATKASDASAAGIQEWFTATEPAGTVRYEMLERGASLALSAIVWVDTSVEMAADAKKARQYHTNKRDRDPISATQITYTVYEDDGTTEAYSMDFDPVTGNQEAV